MRAFSILFVLVLCWIATDGRRKKLPKWHIKMAQQQGPNACAMEEVPETGKQYWTECKYWMHRRICGKKTIIRYECCEGYERVPGEHGCTGVKPLKDILDTAEDLGATIFVNYLKDAGLEQQLRNAGVATLFVPANSAFERITREQRDLLAKSYNNPKSSILLYHLTNKRIHSKDFHTDLLVDTNHNGFKVRLNKYSSGMMTVNCVPAMRKDQEASNGLVHLIEDVLMPIAPKNVYNTIEEDGRFEEFSRLLKETGSASQLQNDGFFTVLVPSDEEFTNIPRVKRDQIKKDLTGRTVLGQNHIVPHTVCLSAIVDEHKMTTLNGHKLTFHCNESGLYVDGSRLTGESLTGANGAIHVVSNLLVPDRAKSIWELTSQYGLNTFSQLSRRTGLEAQLQNYGDVTVFAFTDEAFRDLKQEEQTQLQENVQAARDLLRFHIAPGRYTRDLITDDQKIQSLDGKNNLRMKIYRKGCGVESAMMTKTDIEGLNGVIHIVDRVLTPPSNDMLDLLQKDGNFSIISEAIQKVRAVDPNILSDAKFHSGSMTLFAPSDEAFWKLGQNRLREVMGNTTYLTTIIKNHLVNNMISTGSFKSQLHYNVQTKQSVVEVHKQSNRIKIGKAIVTKPDMITKDGIIHMLDRVLLPDELANARHVYHG